MAWPRSADRRLGEPYIGEGFATDNPSGGLSIDDESGSTLALMVVVRNELKKCEPAYLPEIERLIPAQYRGPSVGAHR